MRERLEEQTEISNRQTLVLLLRALRYIEPFRVRFAIKLAFGVAALLPLLLLPWPVKILVDHVIDKVPIGQSLTPLPFFVRPLVDQLAGSSPVEIAGWAIGLQALLLILVGAIGTSGRENDHTEAYLASGHDTATRTENEANAGFSLSGGILGYFDFRFTIRLTQALNHHYRSKLYERIQSLPMKSFDDERVGDAVYRVMYDTPAITNGCFRVMLTPLLSVMMILATVWILEVVFGSHPRMVYSALALLPLSLVATLPFASAVRRQNEQSRKAGATTTSTVEEGITNILAVQSLGGEEREQGRFDRDSWESFSTYRHLVRTILISIVALLVPIFYIFGGAVLYAIDLVIDGVISRGDFVLFITYFSIIAGAAIEVGALWFRMQGSAAGLHRVFFLMDLPSEQDAPGATAFEELRDGISMDGVSFRFDDGTEAIRNVSLQAPRGQVTALVGPAGAGKTTLAYLLCGYLEPSEGRISIDGMDLNEFTRESLRDHISFVFQETSLFDETVEANIKLGRPDASETDVRRAAKIAGADEFIVRLPEGYKTPLGRGGGKLSVGQKQRLSVARALVRETPILVLDEPTSALDPRTEMALVASLREASRDRAVLVIAHRLSTVRAADTILFVEDGRIIERGSHQELMSLNGSYHRFVELQTRGAA
ncbi:MAG: ABC transporter ATP-binding protein [Myxococcota bacterium]